MCRAHKIVSASTEDTPPPDCRRRTEFAPKAGRPDGASSDARCSTLHTLTKTSTEYDTIVKHSKNNKRQAQHCVQSTQLHTASHSFTQLSHSFHTALTQPSHSFHTASHSCHTASQSATVYTSVDTRGAAHMSGTFPDLCLARARLFGHVSKG